MYNIKLKLILIDTLILMIVPLIKDNRACVIAEISLLAGCGVKYSGALVYAEVV